MQGKDRRSNFLVEKRTVMNAIDFTVLIGSMYIARGMNETMATFVGFGFMLFAVFLKVYS